MISASTTQQEWNRYQGPGPRQDGINESKIHPRAAIVCLFWDGEVVGDVPPLASRWMSGREAGRASGRNYREMVEPERLDFTLSDAASEDGHTADWPPPKQSAKPRRRRDRWPRRVRRASRVGGVWPAASSLMRRFTHEQRATAVRMVVEPRPAIRRSGRRSSSRGQGRRLVGDASKVGSPVRGRWWAAAWADERGGRGGQAAASRGRRAASRQRDPRGGSGLLRGRARPATEVLVSPSPFIG